MDNDRVRQTILEMFEQRGYTDIDDTDENCILATKPDEMKICAFPSIITKLNISEIHAHIAKMEEMKIKHSLIVHIGTPTSAVNNIVDTVPNMRMTIELFHADDLQFNITKHYLQPKFELVKGEFKEKNKLPSMLRSDPIARFYNYQRGSVVKVTRRNSTVSFRVVK
uniref:RNA polymerase subunit H/Rpb5 C-terminal domain-containing protein n=1 Tax=viral metagenome TaxID=1070528 RepID=A0A6C0EJG5_9ZZZZ